MARHQLTSGNAARHAHEALVDFLKDIEAATPIAELALVLGLPISYVGGSDDRGTIHDEIYALAGDPLYLNGVAPEGAPDVDGSDVDAYVNAALCVGIGIGLRLRPEAFGIGGVR